MTIPEIKTQLSIATVLAHYGLKADSNNKLCCPFHADDTPSLQVYPKTNTWHCFGCGKGTDGIDFIGFKELCTTHEALVKATVLVGGQVPQQETKAPTQIVAIATLPREAILTQAFTYYKNAVYNSKYAKDYLHTRGLDITKLEIGYNTGQMHHGTRRDEALINNCVSVGLLLPWSTSKTGEQGFRSFARECIAFAMRDKQGNIAGLYFRSIVTASKDIMPAGAPRHFYLKESAGLYPCYPKENTLKLILTESIIDAATLLQISHLSSNYSILACYGTNRLTDEIQNAIKELKNLSEIVFAFDNDTAGNTAVAKYAELLKNENACAERSRSMIISKLELPNKDVNETYLAYDENIFTHLLEERKLLHGTINKPLEAEPVLLIAGDKLIYTNEHVTATVWGGIDVYNIKRLRATLHLQSRANNYLEYRDTVDLYSHSVTQKLIREASERLETGTIAMQKTIVALTKALENYREEQRENYAKQKEADANRGQETFTTAELQQGKAFLLEPNLMALTQQHIENIGLVGEEEKGMLLFFILLTRMFKNPLHALVQGKSGSGKTYLLKKIASLIPKAHIRMTTALTENTLYHSTKGFWTNKVLLIEDLDGVLSALLPLREMMSNQSISKMSTEKDMKTGEFGPKQLYVEGPICVAGATTKDSIYEDNANRSFLLQVNETNEHQEKVLEYQRKQIAGMVDNTTELEAQLILKCAQLHLKPIEIIIPFAEELRLPDYIFKKLRTNTHYLTLIKAIAFWHQAQRTVYYKNDTTPYIRATLDDVAWANKLSREVLLRKSDELNGAQRAFFETVKSWLKSTKQDAFYAKQLREKLRITPMQTHRYLRDLEQRGYLKLTGGNRKTGFEYSVTTWDDYEQLKQGLNLLDNLLNDLKANYKEV